MMPVFRTLRARVPRRISGVARNRSFRLLDPVLEVLLPGVEVVGDELVRDSLQDRERRPLPGRVRGELDETEERGVPESSELAQGGLPGVGVLLPALIRGEAALHCLRRAALGFLLGRRDARELPLPDRIEAARAVAVEPVREALGLADPPRERAVSGVADPGLVVVEEGNERRERFLEAAGRRHGDRAGGVLLAVRVLEQDR